MKRYLLLIILLTAFMASEELYSQNRRQRAAALGDTTVSIKPTFKGEEPHKSFPVWMMRNIKYPPEAVKYGLYGKVVLKFVVDTTGQIGDFEILESMAPIFDEEVLRVAAMSPKWEPAIHKGKLVRCQYTFPILFDPKSGVKYR